MELDPGRKLISGLRSLVQVKRMPFRIAEHVSRYLNHEERFCIHLIGLGKAIILNRKFVWVNNEINFNE
jgi:hypothetical protein